MSSKEFAYKGAEETWVVPYTTEYTITAYGASGGKGNTYGGDYNSVGGNGAKVVSKFTLNKGDVLYINVGGVGTGSKGTAKDGAGGGGGGGTFIFLKIPSVTNSNYEFTKGSNHFRALLIAAGGGGTWDESYRGSKGDGKDGVATTCYTPTNFIKYTTETTDPSASTSKPVGLSINQYISYNLAGGKYTRNGSTGQGGFGGGTASDDNQGCGGCWYSLNYIAYSWSYVTPEVTKDGANTGNGRVTIEYDVTPPAPTTPPKVTAQIKKNSVTIAAVNGATSYKLYRNDTFLDTLSTTYLTYLDENITPGNSYSYSYSYIKDGFESLQSAKTTVTAYKPAKPTIKVISEVGYINVTWTKVSNSEGWNVYRNGALLVSLPSTATNYEDHAVMTVRQYQYYVTYIAYGIESYDSDKQIAIAIPPQKATPPIVTAYDDYIQVEFTNNTTASVSEYLLYRNDILLYRGTDTSYTDNDVDINVGYYYRIAYIINNREHPQSSSVFGAIFKLVTDRTSVGDYYNAVDLNRVETKCKELAPILGAAGYKCYGNYKTDWKDLNQLDSCKFDEKEWVTVSQMDRFISNLWLIEKEFCYPPYVDLPETMNYLTYIGANNIEKFLVMVYNCYINMKNDYRYCGMVTCGAESLPQHIE